MWLRSVSGTNRIVKPFCPRTPGVHRDTFTFSAKDNGGGNNIYSLQGMFSISGPNSNPPGPDNGAQGCYFYYYPAWNLVYLAGPSGNYYWLGPTAVGAGGSDLSNGYCTFHAGSSQVTAELPKYIYSITENNQGQSSGGPYDNVWNYWGWLATPVQ